MTEALALLKDRGVMLDVSERKRAELALQWQLYSGSAGSLYGSVPERRAIELALRFFL